MLKIILILAAVLFVIFVALVYIPPYLALRFYRAQGVVTSADRLGFSIGRDIGRLMHWMEIDRREFKWLEFTKEICGGEKLAKISGMIFPNEMQLVINSSDYLEDIYVKQNSAVTKPAIMR